MLCTTVITLKAEKMCSHLNKVVQTTQKHPFLGHGMNQFHLKPPIKRNYSFVQYN